MFDAEVACDGLPPTQTIAALESSRWRIEDAYRGHCPTRHRRASIVNEAVQRESSSDAGARIASEQLRVDDHLKLELIGAGLIAKPERAAWHFRDLAGQTWLDDPTHWRQSLVVKAALFARTLSNTFVPILGTDHVRRELVSLHDMLVTARAVRGAFLPPTLRSGVDCELMKAYRPREYFCYELREIFCRRKPRLEWKPIAGILEELPVESGWQRVQQWTREDDNLRKFAVLARSSLT